jgi:hypothetical protein
MYLVTGTGLKIELKPHNISDNQESPEIVYLGAGHENGNVVAVYVELEVTPEAIEERLVPQRQ